MDRGSQGYLEGGGGRVSKRLVSRNFQSDKQKSRGGGGLNNLPPGSATDGRSIYVYCVLHVAWEILKRRENTSDIGFSYGGILNSTIEPSTLRSSW